ERNGDSVGDQRDPHAQRNGDRHLLNDEIDDGDVAEIALAEIEADIVPQHQEEALGGWLVEAELLFKLRDELRVKALGAAIARGRPARLEALAGHVGARACSKARVCPAGLPRYLGNHLLDGSAR